MITITLHRDAILYDISNIAYITGDLVQDAKAQSGIQDVVNTGNVDRITRIMDKSYNELIVGLSAYNKVSLTVSGDVIETISSDNAFKEPSSYVLSLNMPVDFNKNIVSPITAACHEYMVCMSLFEWFSITKKDEAELYRIKAIEELNKVKGYLSIRVGITKRKMFPF